MKQQTMRPRSEKPTSASDTSNSTTTPHESTTATEPSVLETTNATTKPQLVGWRLYIVGLALCLALFLGALDSSIVATALVTIGHDFNNFIQLQWVVLAYLLTELGFAFIFSRISDIIGRKWASIIAVVILTASSLACGLSQSLTQLILFRAFQGVGGAGVYALPFTVLPEITPPNKFALLSGVSALTFICSSILGPTLGGIITTHTTWRWIFLLNVPIGVFIIALLLIAWPRSTSRPAGKILWRDFDWIGSLLSIAAFVLLIFALQEAGAEAYAWSSGVIIATLTLSASASLALCFWIWYLSSGKRFFEPLVPARVAVHRVLAANAIVSVLVGYILFTVLIELSERFQLVNGTSPQTAGINLLPFLGASAFSSGLCGWLSSEKNRSFYTITFGSSFVILGTGLMSSLSFSSSIPHLVYFYEVILGLGVGSTIVSTIIVVKLNASEEDAASAQGLQSLARILGGNIGLSLATIILNIHLQADLKGILTPTLINDVRHSLNAISEFTPKEVADVAESFARAFQTQMQVCTGVAGVALLCCFMSWQRHPPSFVSLGKAEKKMSKKELRNSAHIRDYTAEEKPLAEA